YTLAAATIPLAGTPVFSAVYTASVAVNWASGTAAGGFNGPGATYLLQASTMPTFLPVAGSSLTAFSSATLTGLAANVTHYFRVQAYNSYGATDHSWFVAGSTMVVAPSSPTAPSAYQSGSSNTLTLVWKSPGDEGGLRVLGPGAEVRVQWSTQTAVFWSTANAQVVIATGPIAPGVRVSTTIADLPSAALVRFNVWARNAAGNWSVVSDTAAAFSSPFSFETVDSAAGVYANSLAVDGAGNLHVGYQDDSPNYDLKYAKYNGASWSLSTIDSAGLLGWNPSVAVLDSERLAIAYQTQGTDQMRVIRSANNGGSWAADADIAAISAFANLGLAADAPGNLYLANHTAGASDFRVARSVGANQWTLAVAASGGGNQYAKGNDSIAVAPDGTVYAMFYDSNAAALKVARSIDGGSSWAHGVSLDNQDPAFTALAVDSDGRLHAAYASAGNGPLKHAVSSDGGQSYTVSTVDSRFIANASLALDGAGSPHIAYISDVNNGGNDLSYSSWTGVAWSTMAVDTGGQFGAPSLALDANGGVHISYQAANDPFGASLLDLRVAHWGTAGAPAPLGGNNRSKVGAPTGFGAAGVFTSSIAWRWVDNAAGELGYRVYYSSPSGGPLYAVGFGTGAAGAVAGVGTSTTVTLSGLAANSTYTAYVAAVSSGGVVTSTAVTVLTLAAEPLSAASTFTMVGASSVTVSWDTNGNALGITTYTVVLTTGGSFPNAFSGNLVSSYVAVAAVPALLMNGVSANATWYLHVAARNHAGVYTAYAALGSTVTRIETPTAITFDEVSTHSITAAAYAATPAFSSMTAGLSGTNIALAGNYQGWHSEGWTTKTGMNTTRYGLAAVALGGRLYAFGGTSDGATELGTNEEYDPVADVWTAKTGMLTGSNYLAAAVAQGRLYALGGGDNGTYRASNQEYDPTLNAWTAKASMPTARNLLAAAVVDGRIYAMGGSNGSNLISNEEYDPATDAWTVKADLAVARPRAAAVSVGGKVYLLGGLNGLPVVDNHAYDPALNSWTAKASMPAARNSFAAAVIGGKVYAIGGSDGGNLALNQEYDPGPDAWTTRASMPTLRHDLGVAALGGRLYAVGGFNGVYLSANERYDPGTASSFTALTPNTLYAFRAKARNSVGMETGETLTFSTYTLAAATMPVGALFSEVNASSVVVNWAPGTAAGGFNGAGATYLVQGSTLSSFMSVAGSSLTANTFAAVPGLFVNATHYFRVRAYNSVNVPNDWYFLGSTVTAIEAPTAIVFDEISTRAITAAAYAAGPAFSSMTVGLSGTNIALAGNYSGWHGESWSARTPMTNARERAASVSLGGKLLVIGGATSAGVPTGVTAEYDPVLDSWAPRAGMATARYDHAAGFVAGQVIVAGGSAGNEVPTSSVEAYDPIANSWSNRNPMPSARLGVAGVVFDGGFFVFGGFNAVYLDTNLRYDLQSDSWSVRASMPTPRRSVEAAVLAGRIHVFDGSGPGYLGTHEAYDPSLNSWSVKAPLPVVHGMPCAGVIGDRIHAVGGDASSLHHVYDFGVDSWTLRSPMPTGRHSAAGTVLGGRLYCSGGYNGSYLPTHERFDPGTASSFTALTPNTLYSFTAKARNSIGVETVETTASTYTLAVATLPQAGAELFPGVFASSITVAWSSGTAAGGYNGPGASYLVQASTMSTFLPVAASSFTRNSSATVSGLAVNVTHYFRVQAYNAADVTDYSWFVLGSTATAIEAPTGVYVEAVTTHSLVASAYAATPAFSRLYAGLSGTKVSLNGVYLSGHGETWTARAAVSAPARESVAAAALGGHVYVAGGFDGAARGETEAYDPAADAWSPRASLSTPRYGLGLASVGGRLYAIGGRNGGFLAVNEAYDPEANAWTGRADMPTARGYFGVAVVDGKIHALGGDTGGASDLNELYDPAGDAWTTRAPLSAVRSHFGAAAIGGKVYAVGGAGPTGAVEEYDPSANAWTARPSMPTAR
ncbi:hypothetical protein EPO15_11950, partial [bacterium]